MKKVVMAFGAFDGIHAGHLYYLNAAKKLGDYLIVVIARDESKWKFTKRYNLDENQRKKLVEELGIADKVILGSQTNALEKVKKIKPNIIAITRYHPITAEILQIDLKKSHLKTKVVTLQIFQPKIYDKMFKVNSAV